MEQLDQQPLGQLHSLLKYRQFKSARLSDDRMIGQLTATAREQWIRQSVPDAPHDADPGHGEWITATDDHQQQPIACRHQLTSLCFAPLGGPAGFIIEKLMPRFPPGRRRFNPRDFRFVSISDPLFHEGSERLWGRLIEHLMIVHDTHFAAIMLNTDHPAHEAMRMSSVFSNAERRRATTVSIVGK